MKSASNLDKSDEHYLNFTNDVQPHRVNHWMSVYHQISEAIVQTDVRSVLEFGAGRGLTGVILKHYGIEYFSVDVSNQLYQPDAQGTIADFEADKLYDMVSSFQTLEHNPPETLVPHLKKMASHSNKYVFISLPYSGRWLSWKIAINLPTIEKVLSKTFTWTRWRPVKRDIEKFRKSTEPYRYHWFEVGDPDFRKNDIIRMADKAGLKLLKSYHSSSLPFHVFFLFSKAHEEN